MERWSRSIASRSMRSWPMAEFRFCSRRAGCKGKRRRTRGRFMQRPDFRIYTGNDLGIDMIEYGSDYLLGLATFAPEKFAERDRLWAEGDPAYYALSDALQHLGNIAFRDPVQAYKHSTAVFLHLT